MSRPMFPRAIGSGAGASGGGAPSGNAGGDLTGTYPNPTIANAAVTLAKMANEAANSLLGNNTGSPAAPAALTMAQVMAALSGTASADFSMNNHKITNQLDPTSAQDSATKAYVDGVAAGLSIKGSARLATAAALPTNIYAAGVITVTATGTLTVDGSVTALGDRILVKNEAAALGNGLYSVTTAGAVGVQAVLTRTTDMNTNAEIPGAFAFVEAGTANAGAGFVVASAGPFTLGTTAITWTQFSGGGELTAGTGITLTGNQVALTVPVAVSSGGTGATTLTSGALLKGAGTGAIAAADLTGDVTTAGALVATIAAGAVTLAKQAQFAANSLRGNNTGSAATGLDLTVAQVKTLLAYVVGDLGAVAAGTILANGTTSSAAPTALSTAATQALLREGAVLHPGLLGSVKAAVGDPCAFGVNTTPLLAASTTYVAKVWLPPGTYTNYLNYCQTVGATLTATTFCFYITNSDATGTLVTGSGSADAANSWLTAGIQSIALGTPLVVTVGAYYFINIRIGAGTTMPKTGVVPTALAQNNGGNNVAPNGANVPRFSLATNNPTGITPPSTSGNLLIANAQAFWVGLS